MTGTVNLVWARNTDIMGYLTVV